MKNEYDYLNDVKMDFTCYNDETFNEKEFDIMLHQNNKKRMAKSKKIFVLAASLSVLAITTAFATGLVGNIIKTISTGHNIFTKYDATKPHQLPDELLGKFFNKNGDAVSELMPADFNDIYDENGNKITEERFSEMFEEAFGGDVLYSNDGSLPIKEIVFENLEEAKKTACFELKIPEYVPDGYELQKTYTYQDEDGSASKEYMTMIFKNPENKEIAIYERILTPETAFEAGTDGELEDMLINGRTVVIMNGSTLSFETEDDVSVTINTRGNISKAELIKMAESIR